MNEPSGTDRDDRAIHVVTRPAGDPPANPHGDVAPAPLAVPVVGDVTAAHAGATLARARIARHMSIEQVAQRIKVAPRQLEEIEAAHWASFPTPAILRGFVRAYAKALDIDSVPLLAELPRIEVTPGQLTGVASVGRPVGSGRRGLSGLGWWLAWGVVAVLLVLAAIVLPRVDLGGWIAARDTPSATSTTPEPPASNGGAASGEPAAGVTSPAPAAPAEPSSAFAQPTPLIPAAPTSAEPVAAPSGAGSSAPAAAAAPAVAPTAMAPVPLAPASPSAAPSATPAVASSAPEARSNPAANAGAAAAPVAGVSRLQLSFARETWIEVRDASGKIVSTGVNAAGSTVMSEGKPPFRLIIGNVPGTTFAVDGRSVDLAPYSAGNVARFTYPPEARQ